MAAVAHADVALYKICVKIETYVGNVLSSTKKDCLSNHLAVDDGKLKWHGSLEELKKIFEQSIGLRGKWSSPGGSAKKFDLCETEQQLSITWYSKKQCSLVLQGDSQATELVRSKLMLDHSR